MPSPFWEILKILEIVDMSVARRKLESCFHLILPPENVSKTQTLMSKDTINSKLAILPATSSGQNITEFQVNKTQYDNIPLLLACPF